MTRIVAGSAGGRTLQVPRSGTRPTSDRVREALFSRLEHLGAVRGARVLDLYAGSGALGLEAASRGAGAVTLVEANRAAAELCRRNATQLHLTAEVVTARVESYLAGPATGAASPADLVLMDPPYDVEEESLARVLTLLAPRPQHAPGAGGVGPGEEGPGAGGAGPGVEGRGWLSPGAVVVVERSRRSPEPSWPRGLDRVDVRTYGDTAVWFAEPRQQP